MRRRALKLSRRDLLALAGASATGFFLPRAGAAAKSGAVPVDRVIDFPGGARLARRALEAYRRARPRFVREGEAAVYHLGPAGTLRVTASAERQRVTYQTVEGEIDIVRDGRDPSDLRVVARFDGPASSSLPPGCDTLRQRPGGVELTYSSELALRYASAVAIPNSRIAAIYSELAGCVFSDVADANNAAAAAVLAR